MIEPWDFKTNDERKEDSIINFIIFCEDEFSEPIYFKYFSTSKIKINTVPNQRSMHDNVTNALSHCEENDLLEIKDNNYFLKNNSSKVWCVFDRDKEDTPVKIRKGNISFNNSIQNALNAGIKVAYSNDAFEFWILLHFEDVDFNDVSYKPRTKYYDKLTDIFKNLSNPNDDLQKVLKYHDFSYKRSLKSENNFRNIVRNEIISKTQVAINRAKKIEKEFAKLNLPLHDKSPFTSVHHLVLELIKYGGKEI